MWGTKTLLIVAKLTEVSFAAARAEPRNAFAAGSIA